MKGFRIACNLHEGIEFMELSSRDSDLNSRAFEEASKERIAIDDGDPVSTIL